MKTTKCLYILSWLLLFPFITQAGDVPGTYTKYKWDPSVTALTSVDYQMTVGVDPGCRANVLFKNEFKLAGTSNVGYTGMEDDANTGPAFVFTVRGATQYETGSPGSYCVSLKGDDGGILCRLPYKWYEGVNYQFNVAYAGGQWLAVTVTDLFTNQSVTLGSILTGATSISPQGMVSRTKYLEARSPNSNCYNQPYSEVGFTAPSGNSGQYQASISDTGITTKCIDSSQVSTSASGTYPPASGQANAIGNLLRGEVAGENGCMDAGNGYTNDVPVTSQNCNEKAESQAWVFGSDGSVRLQSNLCLDVANVDPSPGAEVFADKCTGNASQQEWSYTGTVSNMMQYDNNYCLTAGNAGAQLTLQTCSGNDDQQWYAPALPVLTN